MRIGVTVLDLREVFVHLPSLRFFVREVLGCACPETVFDDVRIGLPALFDTHGVEGGVKILLGERLLVAVVPLARLEAPDMDVPAILARGRDVRDARGFNRYRLVLVGVPDSAARGRLEAAARAFDERVHVHVVDEDVFRRPVDAQ